MRNGSGLNKQRVIAELSPHWLEGLEGDELAEGRRLLAGIVDDWAREADPTPDPAAVHRFQREDLEALGPGRDAAGRLDVLRTRALGRRVDRLSGATYALGRAILQGSVQDGDAQAQGRALLREAEVIAAELDRLPPAPEVQPVRRDLGEAVMEALFAVERKAMSARLAREAGEAQGGPQVRP